MDPRNTPHGKRAAEFAAALVAGQFEQAHAMLTAAAKQQWSVDDLEEEFTGMVDYFETPPTQVEIMQVMTDWPDKAAGDIGWAYAAISDEGDSEAVTVVVTAENGVPLIRSIEWGRP